MFLSMFTAHIVAESDMIYNVTSTGPFYYRREFGCVDLMTTIYSGRGFNNRWMHYYTTACTYFQCLKMS